MEQELGGWQQKTERSFAEAVKASLARQPPPHSSTNLPNATPAAVDHLNARLLGRTRELKLRRNQGPLRAAEIPPLLVDEATGKQLEGLTWYVARNSQVGTVTCRDERHR